MERDGAEVEERREDELDEGDDEAAVDDKLREGRRSQVAVATDLLLLKLKLQQ